MPTRALMSDYAEALPVAASQRLTSLDFIRGIAVLGILVANIVGFGQPLLAYMWPGAFLTPHGETSNWLWVAQFVLVDGKMRGLFSLLFGAGLALMTEKAGEGGQAGLIGLQLRRLGWLLVFGLAHFYLLWRGDILVLYALMGMAALLFVQWPRMNLLVIGTLLYVLGMVINMAIMASPFLIAETSLGAGAAMAETRAALIAAAQEAIASEQAETAILTTGSYADFVAYNLTEHLAEPFTGALLYLFETLPLMLIGMALYRYGLFSGGLDAVRLRRWGWAGVVLGSLATLAAGLWIAATGLTYWGTLAAFMAFSYLPRLPVIVGLAALLALAAPRCQGWLAQRLRAAGQMAFSNYLGTSLVMALVFHPWAGGLWGKLTRPELYLVALGGCVLMLAWSKPWLAHFRFGPLEWLWRCLTYGRLFPMRRKS
ncbi:DUF418 domain-containing protein [Aurantiacibacter xanthus]|uniref:DUF418 domain-containing protein n=1 Tax=Aurantiacibacter xanthus TaxID=1784712 RepID=A0A3A1P1W4_9SPHN|nr:DUF418 domain-containing protein [Aurantiacibacter xanthus]RIV83283.1 DUF418 domain-containing protein [Aurantiacibacter xanthus]